jgi:16S rRNA G966 N2-methylase RsmD
MRGSATAAWGRGTAILSSAGRRRTSWPARAVYDVVFLDPPYDEPDLAAAVTLGAGLLAAGGICVLEHAARRPAPDAAETRRCVGWCRATAPSFYGG